jgi:hypothetical protein
MGNIKPIVAGCNRPWVILADAPPRKNGPENGTRAGWPFIRQALLANLEFRPVGRGQTDCDGVLCFPKAPGQVHFSEYPFKSTESLMLIATCADGTTCERLAAMYKGTIRVSRPQTGCGINIPAIGAEGTAATLRAPGPPERALPGKRDSMAQCARLGACMTAFDHTVPGDPAIDCMKAPSRFKLQCASLYPCSEVLRCTRE